MMASVPHADVSPTLRRNLHMTLPTRWNPISQLSRMSPFFDVDDLFRDFSMRPGLARDYERTMEMRLDVNEDDNGYVVNVDIPGVKKDDIDISIEGNQVTVRAEVQREKSTGKGKGKELYTERYSGQAYRTFSLPSELDTSVAKAAYDGGVLTLTLPKKPGGAVKHLSVG
jgi:HSP20 family protein